MAVKKDFFLKLLLELTRSDMLHVGCSEPGAPLAWDDVAAAQKTYEDRVLACIPEGTKTILEVGCGTGHTTQRLQGLGYQIESLSPDAIQEEIIQKRTGGAVTFYCTKFEDLDIDRRYDLILSMESFGYIKLQQCLRQFQRYLGEGGRVVICDFFRLTSDRDYKSFHIWEDVTRELGAAGFEIELLEDITPNVLPTVELASNTYHRFVYPVVKTLFDSTMHSIDKPKAKKIPLKVARYLYRKKIDALLDELSVRVPRLLSPENFDAKMRYQLLMLKRA